MTAKMFPLLGIGIVISNGVSAGQMSKITYPLMCLFKN